MAPLILSRIKSLISENYSPNKELDDEIIVITSNKKPIAAIVSLKNVDKETLSLSTNPEFLEIIEKAREEFNTGKKLSFDEMKREFPK